MNNDGLEDAAILLMSLGESEAAEVFRHLTPKEVQRLGETIARLKIVPRERLGGVLDRFASESMLQGVLVADTGEYVRNVLRKALGDDKANLLLDRILQGNDVSAIEGLKWVDAPAASELLRNEHPQIVAAILAHLEPEHAAGILKHMGERQRHEVVLRLATLEGVHPTALRDLNDVLSNVMATGDSMRKTALGGVKNAAEIVNLLGSQIEQPLLDYMRGCDPDTAQKLVDNLFRFDDILKFDDKAIQAMLREVQGDQLAVSLKGAEPELREKVLRNMSSRAAESLREDIDSRGPMRLVEVQAEQNEILKVVRRLADEGQITMPSGGADEFV